MGTLCQYARHPFPSVFPSLQAGKRLNAPREEFMTSAGTSLRGAARAPSAGPPRTHHQVFPARAEQVREARRFLARLLAGWPVDDDAILCLSELAANATIHSQSGKPGGHFTVRAEIHGDHLRVEVHDQGGPWTRLPRGDEPHGRGLLIVSQLSRARGRTGDSGTGWTVWFEMHCP
jgi:anti-sigma regulatory factor (Ser/Thr protein kinase)